MGSKAYGSQVNPTAAFAAGPIVDDPEQHAFVMLGQKALFLSHLTMYGMEEHNFQLVLQAKLPEDALRQYHADRATHPDSTYFLGNSPQDLFTVPDISSGIRKYFISDIFRGIPQLKKYESWPWANQTPVVGGVRCEIERIVYFRHLALTFEAPTTLTYALFGEGDEAHLINCQTKIPDFDHVVSLSEVPNWLTETQLRSGVHVSINAHRTANTVPCSDPLPVASELAMVKYRGAGPDLPIKLGYHHWFCTKIANNPAPDPCGENSLFCGTPP